MNNSKRCVKRGSSKFFLASGEISIGWPYTNVGSTIVSSTYFSNNFLHSKLFKTVISTPFFSSKHSAPINVVFSPITTFGISYNNIAPEHIGQGERVVYNMDWR